MTVTVGVDSYVDEAALADYCAKRGKILIGDPSVNLIIAMDYLNVQDWSGVKTDPAQALDFPRNGATQVPKNIQAAQIELAILADSGITLLDPVGPATKREKVDVIEVEYQDNAGSITYYPIIDKLITPFLNYSGAFGFQVRRG